MPKALFILGPTAVGKTKIAVEIAKRFNGEIISCDSVQIFRGLDIGSAKVTEEEKEGIPHHLLDIVDAKDNFSAFMYAQAINEKIEEIQNRNKLPIVAGGTSLYVKSVILGYNFGGVDKDENLRKSFESENLDDLVKKLKALNPTLEIDFSNRVRVIRALEIEMGKGSKESNKPNLDSLIFAIVQDRETLYQRINKRVEKMLEDGLVEEVKNLKTLGLTREHQSMKAIGYKEVLDYLDGLIDEKKMADLIKQHTRNYAKRQLTFLRGMENVNYVDSTDFESLLNIMSEKIKEWLNG